MNASTARATAMAVGMASLDKISHRIEIQARICQLLINEAITHADPLMDDIRTINKMSTGKHAHDLDFFEHIDLAARHMFKFIERASQVYRDGKAFDKGTLESTDAFTDLMETIFGYDFKGEPLDESKRFRLLMCTAEEEQLFYTWWRRHNKAQQHVFKNIDRNTIYEKAEDVKITTITPGWNAQPIVMHRGEEWREFSSIAEAVKNGFSRKKIQRALENNGEYAHWYWTTKEDWEKKKDE